MKQPAGKDFSLLQLTMSQFVRMVGPWGSLNNQNLAIHMKQNIPMFLLGLSLVTLGLVPAQGAVQILGDNYNVTGSGSGFALGSGVNSGINPPTTRLTGTAAANLRYINTGI